MFTTGIFSPKKITTHISHKKYYKLVLQSILQDLCRVTGTKIPVSLILFPLPTQIFEDVCLTTASLSKQTNLLCHLQGEKKVSKEKMSEKYTLHLFLSPFLTNYKQNEFGRWFHNSFNFDVPS